jgi:hypothetical protein
LAFVLVCLVILIANAEFRDGSVVFLSAWLALSLSGLICLGLTIFFVGTTGWFFAALRRRRAR